MSTPNTLDARVAGTTAALPAHPRIESPTLASLLLRQPPAPARIAISAPLAAALASLGEAHPAALLVMDGEQLCGLCAATDIVAALHRTGSPALDRPVGEAMTPCPHHAGPADSLLHGLRLVREHDLPFLPVLDDGRILGLLSRGDLLAAAAAHYEKVFRELALDQQILFLRGTYSC